MNGKQLSLILAFLCWLSLLTMNWLLLLNVIERGSNFVIATIVFMVMAIFFGCFTGEVKRK